MNDQIKKGFGFGITSGIITTLGLIVGFYSGAYSRIVIIGGILIIAISDSMSDALGIHISEEFEGGSSEKEVWMATGFTFLFKFFFAMLFVLWFLFFSVKAAVFLSVAWGTLLIVVFSLYLAKKQKVSAFRVIFEHVFIMFLVICITYFVGSFVGKIFV